MCLQGDLGRKEDEQAGEQPVRACVCVFLGTSAYAHLYNDVVCVPKPVSLCTHGAVCACVELCLFWNRRQRVGTFVCGIPVGEGVYISA